MRGILTWEGAGAEAFMGGSMDALLRDLLQGKLSVSLCWSLFLT